MTVTVERATRRHRHKDRFIGLSPTPKKPGGLATVPAGSRTSFVWKRRNRWGRPVTRLSAVARHGLFDAPGAHHRLRSDDGRYVDRVSAPEGWRGRTLTYTVVLDDGSRHSIDVRFGRGERVRHRSR